MPPSFYGLDETTTGTRVLLHRRLAVLGHIASTFSFMTAAQWVAAAPSASRPGLISALPFSQTWKRETAWRAKSCGVSMTSTSTTHPAPNWSSVCSVYSRDRKRLGRFKLRLRPLRPFRFPVLPLSNYCGVYSNPAYGNFTVSQSANNLMLTMGPQKFQATWRRVTPPARIFWRLCRDILPAMNLPFPLPSIFLPILRH